MASEITRPLYIYHPLPSPGTIRLVQLYPAADISEPLDFEFVLQDRFSAADSESLYDAVSYVWGQAPFTEFVHSRSTGTYLNVSPTVDGMLRDLRMKSKQPRPLWVDAICLNQADNDEKSVQVPLMGGIYHQARTVHIWMGEFDHDIAKAFKILQTMALQMMQPRKALKATFDKSSGSDGFTSIQKLLHQPWFGRRWVIQEASLSHDTIIHCGQSCIGWRWFTDGLDALEQLGKDTELDQTALDAMRASKSMKRHAGTILEILWDFHNSDCLDPRDRIFAIYGLATDIRKTLTTSEDGSSSEIVSYSNHWKETYTSLTMHLVKHDTFAEVFRQLFSFGNLWHLDPSLPSWVPDWSSKRRAQHEFPFTVNLHKEASMVQQGGYTGVKLYVKILGEVDQVHDKLPADARPGEIAKTIIDPLQDSVSWEDEVDRCGLVAVICLAQRQFGSSSNAFSKCFETNYGTRDFSSLTSEESALLYIIEGIATTACEELIENCKSKLDVQEVECQDPFFERYLNTMIVDGPEEPAKIQREYEGDSVEDEEDALDLALIKAKMAYFETGKPEDHNTSRVELFLQDFKRLMEDMDLFRCEHEMNECGTYFIGSKGIKKGDFVGQFTTPQGIRQVLEEDGGHSLFLILRPVADDGDDDNDEDGQSNKLKMFKLVGYCLGIGTPEFSISANDEEESACLTV